MNLVIDNAGAQTPQAPAAATATQSPPPSDPGWPRTFTKDGTTLTIYQPQIDAWKDYEKMKFRCALEVQLAGATDPAYGVVAVQADTSVDENSTHVYITNMKVAALRFPGASDADAAALKAVVLDMLPNKPMLELSMARVMAYMHGQAKPKTALTLCRAIARLEAFEDQRQEVGFDSAASVGHLYFNSGAVRDHRHVNSSAVGEFHRVGEDIGERLLQAITVAFHHAGSLRQCCREGQVGRLR